MSNHTDRSSDTHAETPELSDTGDTGGDATTRDDVANLFYRQPRLIALTLLVLIAAGASAFLSIARQEDPTITNLFATVTTVYPGADPARVEALVTEKIETELAEIASIDTLESTSASGISIINIELLETLDDAAIEVAWTDVRAALDDAERRLPSGAQAIEFDNTGAGTFASIVALTPGGNLSMSATSRYAAILADRLRAVSGTDSVERFGVIEEEVSVEIDSAIVSTLGLDIDRIAQRIRVADAKVQAGRARAPGADWIIEVHGEIDALDRLAAIPLVSGERGVVRLGDVARITRGARQPLDEVALSAGERSVLVAARIDDGLQVDVWMSDVRAALDEFEQSLPRTLSLEILFDQSDYTRQRLGGVAVNLAIGMSLVIGVLLITLGARSALIVALVLPLVTLASVATLNAVGIPIHQMSLTGLIVALGLLVDSAIVMTDEIGQRLQRGVARAEAVRSAVRRLFAPLLASTATTALSFMPMVLLPGPAGDFVGAIAISVIIMLVWSFLIAMTVTAGVAGHLLKPGAIGSRAWHPTLITRGFRRSLVLAMRYPASAVLLALVPPVTGFIAAGGLEAQFFPGVDRDQFHIEVELAPGRSIDATQAVVARIDKQLESADGIEQVAWVIGRSAPPFYYNMLANRDRAPAFAQALVTTDSADSTARLVPELQKELDSLTTDARVLVRGLVQGPPVNAPVEIRLVGPRLDVLRSKGDELRALMVNLDEITTVRTSLDGGAPKLDVQVSEERARMAGLGLVDVAQQLDAWLEGRVGGTLLDATEELPIRVRLPIDERRDIDSVRDLPILPPGARSQVQDRYQALPLSAIADVSVVPAVSSITRRNGERINTVQGFIRSDLLPEEALKRVQSVMQEQGFVMPPGYRIQIGGDSDARNSTLNNLVASLGIIVTLSIASIVVTFNSFRLTLVTLMVAGLSAGLSLLALAVFQYPFGIQGIIGVIGSIGVSINAAIIILTGLDQNAESRAGDPDAMVEVVMGSSRHIVSTTVTTFGGFLPLIVAGGGFWPPFAMAIAGGVLLSTIVSFYFTPPMYRLLRRRQRGRPADRVEENDSTYGEYGVV